MPGERHPQEILKRLWGGVIRDLMGAKTERLILAFSFGGVSLRALHQARVCISRVVSYRKHHHDFSYVYPPSRRVALARRAALAREPRAGEQSGAAPLRNARSRRHCWISDIAPSAGALDGTFGVTPLFAESLRAARHLVRRMAMRWVVVAPRGVPARGGCGGGLVGSQEDCALLASWRGRCGGRPPM